MPSSISSSDRILPSVPWIRLLAGAAGLIAIGAAAIELRLAELGYEPTARDSPERWQAERARAARLGARALILVGASRFQLGLDLDVLREETGLEPVQLALDGSTGEPILEGLANDPGIHGTILFDYYDHAIGARDGAAVRMQRLYEQSIENVSGWRHPAERIEGHLDRWLHERLRAYADGANPLSSLRWRIIPSIEAKQYLIMRPDRSRLADYTRVDMPEFYLSRVARTLGKDIDARPPDTEAHLEARIATLGAGDDAGFVEGARRLGEMANRIRSRGGRVAFVAMPSSGLIREIEMRRYPRVLFWDRLLGETGMPGMHAAYDPALQGFSCPDGSHLDMRDRARFTKALAKALRERGLLEAENR